MVIVNHLLFFSVIIFIFRFFFCIHYSNTAQNTLNKEANSKRKRERKRKADDQRKQKDKEQLADRLSQYIENNKTTIYSNLGIQQGLVDTQRLKQPNLAASMPAVVSMPVATAPLQQQ